MGEPFGTCVFPKCLCSQRAWWSVVWLELTGGENPFWSLGRPGLGKAVLNLQIQALGKFLYVWKGLEIKRARFQLRECWLGFPLGIVFCVNFLKTFTSFCQQGQRQIDPGDEVAERVGQSRGQNHS